ncbi:MAG TPA: WxL domain-containing protein [Solirubrobacteraceae bacterium]|nr:WxL domain-containing protein [Solirubrobacteraceae bacterium]
MRRVRGAAACLLACACALILGVSAADAAFEFGTAPKLPTLSNVTLNAQAQTVNTTMTGFSVTDTRGTKSGWNVTVIGQAAAGKSAVFAQYCPKPKCGTDAEGYVAAGQKLAANSLKLNSTGAKFAGGAGAAPTFLCAAGCNVDSAAAVKVASAATGGAGESTWTASGFSATSLQLTVPTTIRALANEEVYRVNLLWTLATGP